MELKQIKELMSAMGRTGTKRLTLKKEDFELVLEREDQVSERLYESQFDGRDENGIQTEAWQRVDQALSRASDMPNSRFPAPLPPEQIKEDVNSQFVTSPMVGTFYQSPSPEDPPFVKVGDRVEKNDVVCIIEAMKVLNEIKANVSGTVAEVLVETAQPVEFGTKLFRIIE